ncbi:MAG: hypothetical protein HYX66_08935 [Ignavibacteria bacterium]|nr:hypothetical protein [Ignavibacteria bacterium]
MSFSDHLWDAETNKLSDIVVANYPVAITARYFSASKPELAMTDPAIIADSHDGFFNEMERIGVARDSPLDIADLLIPINSEANVIAARRLSGIVLEEISFAIFDTKRTDALLSTGVQNAAVNTAYTASLATDNNIIPQSNFLNGVAPEWQPNWFLPRVTINGKTVYGVATDTTFAGHKGFGSIGAYTNVVRKYAIFFAGIKNIEVRGRCVQRVRTAAGAIKYVPYAVMCEITFRVHW